MSWNHPQLMGVLDSMGVPDSLDSLIDGCPGLAIDGCPGLGRLAIDGCPGLVLDSVLPGLGPPGLGPGLGLGLLDSVRSWTRRAAIGESVCLTIDALF